MPNGLQFLVVGNLSHDLLVCEGREVATLGGPPAYMARFFDAVGAHYRVVTKVGDDFLYADEFPRDTLLGRKPTASLVHWLHGPSQKSLLLSAGDRINPDELRDRATVGIVAGHVNEVPVSTVRRLRDLSDHLLVDAQAILRTTNNRGRIHLQPIHRTPFWQILDCFDLLKLSFQEARFVPLDLARERTTLVVTMAGEGCKILTTQEEISVPTAQIRSAYRTGAGDIFLAAFGWGILNGWSLRSSGEFANQCAVLALERPGLPDPDAFTAEVRLVRLSTLPLRGRCRVPLGDA